MTTKRDVNSVLAAAIEGTEGVAQALNTGAGANDILTVEGLQIRFNETQQTTQENTGSLDPSSDIPIGGAAVVSFETWLRGSGTGATPPETGKLFKASGYSEAITAAAIGAPTAATAGTGSSITVPGATFVGGVDAYKGMVAQLTGNPAGPQFAAITAFSAGQIMSLAETFAPILSNATLVQIPAGVLYVPISTGIPSLTMGVWKDGVYHTVIGCRGTPDFAFESGKGIKLSWTFQGILTSRIASANPTASSPDRAQGKIVWENSANNGAFVVNGKRRGTTMFNFKTGAQLDSAPNPNQPLGFDVADIVARTMSGDLNPRLTDPADEDFRALKRNGTLFPISAIARRGAGGSLSLLVPQAQLTSYEYEKQGQATGQKLPFKATGSNTGAYLYFF